MVLAQQTPLPVHGTVFFISDLHLSLHMPKTAAAFLRFVDEVAPQAQALFILGDFFEYWIGDDALSQNDAQAKFNLSILDALKQLAKSHTKIYWMAGNRDFLLGDKAAQYSQIEVLNDPCLIQLGTQRILLSHGDLLCTDDIGYQRMRTWFRKTWVQNIFLNLPISWRKKLALKLRGQEKDTAQASAQSNYLVDVNDEAVSAMHQRYQSKNLIHGHTHRPAHHTTTAGQRWVLSDWDLDTAANNPLGAMPRANYLQWREGDDAPSVHRL